MLIKRDDGDSVSATAFVSMYCAKSGNRALIHAWNLQWIFWLTVFTILFFLSLLSLMALSREPTVNPLIRPCILLTMVCASGILFVDRV